MRDWEQEIIGTFKEQSESIPSDSPGSTFILIQADGEIFDCISKAARLGNVYENKLNLRPMNRPACFQKTNICPSIKANHDMYHRFTPHRS
jgi:hypothetical protein